MCEGYDCSIGQKRDDNVVHIKLGETIYRVGSRLEDVYNALESMGTGTPTNNLGEIDNEFHNLPPIVFDAIKERMKQG